MSQRVTTKEVDLAKTFSAVTRTLKANQEALNEADAYNHNHGDNMVKNFQVITRAMRQKKESPPAEQLAYASQALAQRSSSGSAQLYSQGLAEAAQRFQGERAITPDNAMTLIQALMGSPASAPQASASQSDPMSQLLGGLLGGQMGQTSQSAQAQPASDMGTLLGGLLGGQSMSGGSQQGLDMGDLLNAGMAFFQARQQGATTVQALTQALMSGSQMNNSTHHSQSGQLVTQTLINVIGSMVGGKRR